ncbi:DNA ligase, partial [[Clostridium] symbiosum]|nr:DNA ligase [[Clostridium] symbiosum]
IKEVPQIPSPLFAPPHVNENAIWIEPQLVCVVKFMEYTANGGMRQPVFKGLRPDKLPTECRSRDGMGGI